MRRSTSGSVFGDLPTRSSAPTCAGACRTSTSWACANASRCSSISSLETTNEPGDLGPAASYDPFMTLSKPFWANQPATKGQRAVLWFLFCFLASALALITWSAITTHSLGVIRHDGVGTVLIVAIDLYLCLLFLHIARTGKAPAGWAPW